MTDRYEPLREALEKMKAFGAWHKSRSHINIDESEEWCPVQIDVRANRDASRKVAGYIKEVNPQAITALLSSHDAQAAEIERLREALSNLYHSLPDVLPSGALSRFEKTGKWSTGRGYGLRGLTGNVEYRSDDMECVYSAMDTALLAQGEQP